MGMRERAFMRYGLDIAQLNVLRLKAIAAGNQENTRGLTLA
jgi:hypothetical protein